MQAYRLAADLVLVLHAAYIAFVLLGLVCVLLGMTRRWAWTRNFWFRAAHLLAIAYVVVQAFYGMVCPLTTLENVLRVRGGEQAYAEGGFIQFWLHRVIFFDAESWVFTLCYTLFGLLVAATMWWAPPRSPWPRPQRQASASAPSAVSS